MLGLVFPIRGSHTHVHQAFIEAQPNMVSLSRTGVNIERLSTVTSKETGQAQGQGQANE